jgi:hypothetical protein
MQLELSLNAPTQADLADVAHLASWLYTSGDRWIGAKEISASLGLGERQIRNLAASSGGIIVSSPGSPGYKHVKHCDGEEIKSITARLEHQAKLMAQRAGAIRSAFHHSAA